MTFPKHIFREYDIRGVVGSDLSDRFAFYLGIAYGQIIAQTDNPLVHVAFDGRLSSPSLANALCVGLAHAEVEVVNIGLGPTPMLYHAVCAEKSGGGIMVTGSHNPPDHNGFKIMLGTAPFYGAQIQELYQQMCGMKFPEMPIVKANEPLQPYAAYLDNLKAEGQGVRPLKVVWDCGNGATGDVVELLAKAIPGTHLVLNGKIDGTFPAHHPDPSEPHNMQQLIEAVRAQKADVGIAFDGDGDRIGAVDELGNIIAGDQLVMLFAQDLLTRKLGATIIADVKSSAGFLDVVSAHGGTPMLWKTGHSNIKSKMKEVGALLAGEMSGHIFFAENYYGFDDAVLAAVRLLKLLGDAGKPLTVLRGALPAGVSTPEIRIPWDEDKKFAAIDAIKGRLLKERREFLDIDGVRVETPDGWWLLRASNTQAILVARAEAKTAQGLEVLKADLQGYLKAA